MTPSSACFELIKEFEGFRLRAYQDSVGIWTIGIGTTRYPDGSPVKAGDVCTMDQAESYLMHDLDRFAGDVIEALSVPVTQNEYDALVCWTYNVGSGAMRGSTLMRKLNAGDRAGAAEQFARWNKAGGAVLAGLTRRRAAERALFVKE